MLLEDKKSDEQDPKSIQLFVLCFPGDFESS